MILGSDCWIHNNLNPVLDFPDAITVTRAKKQVRMVYDTTDMTVGKERETTIVISLSASLEYAFCMGRKSSLSMRENNRYL